MTNCLICCCRTSGRFTAERQRAGGAGCGSTGPAALAERARTLITPARHLPINPVSVLPKVRHPVVEQVLNEPFIANPLNLSPQRRMLIITGPNMVKYLYAAKAALITCWPISAVTFRRKT